MKTPFHWLEEHRDWAIEFLRMGLGAILIQKGLYFMQHMDQLLALAGLPHSMWISGLFAHYIVVTHVVGGIFLLLGLVTRVSAAIQLPVLAGAVVVLYRSDGLSAAGSTLEFTFLVLLLTIMFLFYGGGKISVDAFLQHASEREKTVA